MKNWLAVILTMFLAGVVSAQDRDFEKTLTRLAKSWVDAEAFPTVTAEVEEVRKRIQADAALAEATREFIAVSEDTRSVPFVEIAAMHDIIGDFDAASERYKTVTRSSRGRSAPHAARLHLIRLLRRENPEWETSALGNIKHSTFTQRFEFRIGRMESLIVYLESQRAAGRTSAGDTARFESLLGSGSYGSSYLPPIWLPNIPPEHGSAPPAEMIEMRHATCEKLYRTVLQFPDDAAWAFSRLAGLAEVRGEFFDNPELVELAKQAIATASAPTPFGGIEPPQRSSSYQRQVTIRLVSPELYLAHHLWKSGAGEAEAAAFGPGVLDRFALFACDPAAFTDQLNAIIGDDPTGQAVEAVHLWALRGHDADLFDYMLDQEVKFAAQRENFRGNPQRAWLDYLDATARKQRPTRVRDALKQLTYVYLGGPGKREGILETLRERPRRGQKTPMATKYAELLRAMGHYPALVFSAHSAAETLGIADLTSPYGWIDEDALEATPERVIVKLEYSPFVKPLRQFRLIEADDNGFIHLVSKSKPTVFGKLAYLMTRLSPEERKPYLDYLTEQDTFGADLLLATLSCTDGSAAEAFLFENLAAIRADADDLLEKDLAVFVAANLPTEGERSAAIREALASGLERANVERADKLVDIFSRTHDVHGSNGSILPLIIRDSPDLAMKTLHRIIAARDANPPTDDDRGALARRNYSWASELIRYAHGDLDDTPADHNRFVAFYLRVMNDPEMGPRLSPRTEWLAPRSFAARSVEDRRAYFEKAVAVVADNLPDSAPAEWLFLPVYLQLATLNSPEDPEFDAAYLAALSESFSGDRRKVVDAAIVLGKIRDQQYMEGIMPEKGDPADAAAYAEMGERLRDNSVPLNLRLELARQITGGCGQHAPAELRNQFTALLAGAWESGAVVPTTIEQVILENFILSSPGPAWRETADQLLAAWKKRVAAMDRELGQQVTFSHAKAPVLLIGIAATLDDDATLDWLLESRWKNLHTKDPIVPLTLLVRAGKFDQALTLQQNSMPFIRKAYGFGGVETDGAAHISLPHQFSGNYDLELHKNLPAFLERIESPRDRARVWMFISSPGQVRGDPDLPDKTIRYTEIAKYCLEVDLQDEPYGPGPMYRQLALDPEAAAVLCDGLVAAIDFETLDESLRDEDDFRWQIYGEAAIGALLQTGKYAEAREFIDRLVEATRPDNEAWNAVWKLVSGSIHRCGQNLVRKSPEKLRDLLPITRHVAALELPLPALDGALRAENHARNIVWHAMTDTMDEWLQWRAELPEKTRTSLEATWHPRSNRIFGVARLIIRSSDLEQRLAVTRRMIRLPEVIGTSGPLHDDLLANLLLNNFFKEEDLLEHGAALLEGVLDGGKALKALEAMRP